MKTSINSRRGGTANTNTDMTALTWWKFLFLASLILLVSFLIRLNYQLVQEISRPDDAALIADNTKSDAPDVDSEAEQRLKSLRSQVSGMKEKLGTIKGLVDDIQQQQQDGGGGGALSLQSNGKAINNNNNNNQKEFPRLTCTAEVAKKQANRMNARFAEWWSHSACPDQVWMENINEVFDVATGEGTPDSAKPYLILDIGCNKGYTSADFLDALSPGTNMNPRTLVGAIRSIAREMNTKFDRDGGVCQDSDKPLNKDRTTKSETEVHCFEPSPATYNMLTKARTKLMPPGETTAIWHIHNVGLHEVNGQMSWHNACATAVGDELCTIVPEGTKDAVPVPVVTVDKFLEDAYPNNNPASAMPLVHMLKIDAEGLDPAVLVGSTTLLKQNRAIMVMFEFNPGLSEKDPPHGMWGRGGNPRKKLLEVTAWLDELGYDCYLDTRHVDEKERAKGVSEAPALYRITGGCLTEEPRVRGWANVVCASRKYGNVASLLRNLATMV